MMTKYLLIAASAALALSTQAQAQDKGRHDGWEQDQTRAQAQQRADDFFQRLDLNHDGTVTRTEVDQVRAQMGGSDAGGGRADRMIARVFGDAQSVTLAQFEAQSLARFDSQDLNHDGTVTAAERQQARDARKAQAQ
jgi:Ca2+-binding EF-hand superfamily protein